MQYVLCMQDGADMEVAGFTNPCIYWMEKVESDGRLDHSLDNTLVLTIS